MNLSQLIPRPRSGASPAELSGLAAWTGLGIPEAFAELLRYSNGVEDWSHLAVSLWPAEDIPKLNEAYEVREHAPGLILIGSDGGGEAVALDTKSTPDPNLWPVVLVPFVGMSNDLAIRQASSFAAWVQAGLQVVLPTERSAPS